MRLGASPLQKCIAAIHMLVYGCTTDQVDKYLKLGESTARECHGQFVEGVIAQFGTEDLWIWHAFFGTSGSCNDINVLQRSLVFDDTINNSVPQELTEIITTKHIITDRIYPKWSTFIDAISAPQTLKDKLFTERQESARKYIECAFGVLQARFAISRKPTLAWSVELMWKIMMTCIIIHNMIIEDERDTNLNYKDPLEFGQEHPENMPGSSSTRNATTFVITPGHYEFNNFSRLIVSRGEIRNRQVHVALKNDLVEHLRARSRSSVEN